MLKVLYGVAVLFFVGLIVSVWWFGGYLAWRYFDFQQEKSGPWGDTFGAVNSLFTALAFAGVIVTIWLQVREMANARAEAQANEEAQQRQARILEKTATLNALIALAEHAGNAYERAIMLGLPETRREERATDYDRHVIVLRRYVEQSPAEGTTGFDFLSMEREARDLPPLKVEIAPVGNAGSSGPRESRKCSFRVKVRLTNLTDEIVTIQNAEAYLRSQEGELLLARFTLASGMQIQPKKGTAELTAETKTIRAQEEQLPTLGLVRIRIVGRTDPIRVESDPVIAAEAELRGDV
jgi:hypothetical protein